MGRTYSTSVGLERIQAGWAFVWTLKPWKIVHLRQLVQRVKKASQPKRLAKLTFSGNILKNLAFRQQLYFKKVVLLVTSPAVHVEVLKLQPKGSDQKIRNGPVQEQVQICYFAMARLFFCVMTKNKSDYLPGKLDMGLHVPVAGETGQIVASDVFEHEIVAHFRLLRAGKKHQFLSIGSSGLKVQKSGSQRFEEALLRRWS